MASDVQIAWMKRALEKAREAESLDEVPVGAVLVCDGEVIAAGGNLREYSGKTTAHAEIVALETYNRLARSWRLPAGTTLYVTTEPCLMCTGALLWARLDHVVYGCSDPKKAGIERIRPLIEEGIYDHKIKTIEGSVLGEECQNLISTYFRKKRQG